jgi:NADP-dependent 3-hydroxy acid dehydrogenase YdfG
MDPHLALVTGAGRGYGAVVARRLADRGVTVALLGRDAVALQALADDIGGVPLVADVLDGDAVDARVQELQSQHGAVDVLVNNAGVGGPLGLAWEVDRDAWWHTLEVNVRGTHNVTCSVLPAMVAARSGRVINVVSHAGTHRWPYGSAYAVSKAAAIKLGENLAAEVRRQGVTVLNFHPGILEIGLTDSLFKAEPAPGTTEAMVAQWFRDEIAAGHSVDAEVSAGKLVRLAMGEADALSGRYLTAYDDLDEVLAHLDDVVSSSAYTLGLITP